MWQYAEASCWSVFFKFAPDIKRRDLVNKVIAERKEIAMAGELLLSISKDEHERAHYRSRRMYETDMASNELSIKFNEARRIARNLKNIGVHHSIISDATGLNLTDVENA